MNTLKAISLLIVFCLPIFSGCSGLTARKWVDSENIYYSENYPPLKISVSKEFAYVPDHPINKKHNAELFIKETTRETVFIKNYTGNYDPDYTFFSHRMYDKTENIIGGIKFYVGTEIKKEDGEYFLKKVYVHYPDLKNMFVLMQTMPLSEYGYNLDWSLGFENYTDRQKDIIKEFKKRKDEEVNLEKFNYNKKEGLASQFNDKNNTSERLEKLSELLKKGLITEKDYQIKKQEILKDI